MVLWVAVTTCLLLVYGDARGQGQSNKPSERVVGDFSPQLWANKNRGKVALSALGIAAGLALLWKSSRD